MFTHFSRTSGAWGVAESVLLDKSTILGVGVNYNVIPRCCPSPPAKGLVDQHMHNSDTSCDSVLTSVPISAHTLPFGLAQSVQSLGSVRPGWVGDAVVRDIPVAHGISWFTVLTLGASGNPSTTTAISGLTNLPIS